RSAHFSVALALDPNATGALRKEDLQYRILVELDGGRLISRPMSSKIRIAPGTAFLDIENRGYRGALEIFGNSRNTLTVVNELPLETYMLGVVPNELSPTTFGQL